MYGNEENKYSVHYIITKGGKSTFCGGKISYHSNQALLPLCFVLIWIIAGNKVYTQISGSKPSLKRQATTPAKIGGTTPFPQLCFKNPSQLLLQV